MKQQYVCIKDNKLKYINMFSIHHELNLPYDATDEYKLSVLRKNGYTVCTLAEAYKGLAKEKVIRCGDHIFYSIEDAAAWCLSNGLSTATLSRIISNIRKNLEGTTSQAYKRNFKYDIIEKNIDFLDIL